MESTRPNDAPPLRAAALRWESLPSDRRAPTLASLTGLGFNAVELPVAWSAHAATVDGATFEGVLDLAAAVRASLDAGLRVALRVGAVGPLPAWVTRDDAMASLTRRRTPRLSVDGARLVALPSLSSRAYTTACSGFVGRVCDALGPLAARVERWVVDAGAAAEFRGGPWDSDHHPDAPEGVDDPTQRALDEAGALAAHLDALAAALTARGVDAARVTTQVPGRASQHPAVASLAARWTLGVRVPGAGAGATAIWREVGSARAPRGRARVRSGGPRAAVVPRA
ncbi:MAG: beta-galactosidase [Polyangiales bacterium]